MRNPLLVNMAALRAHVVELHARLCRSLLRLKEHGFVFFASGALLLNPWQRWILADVLGDAGSFTDCVAKFVAKYAGCGGRFAVCAGPAREVKGVLVLVFFWVKHVGAFSAEAEGDLFWLLLLVLLSGRRRHG